MMIITAILLVLATIVTIFLCKTVAANFDKRNEILVEKEKKLYSEQEELRKKRRNIKRQLAELKKSAKEVKSDEKEPSNTPTSLNLKDWLEKRQSLDSNQYSTASQFADEKNMNLLSAMLTLNIISVETYEEAKKLKLKA
ncbi:hypothetical protein [Maridesulfovibrio ferrireducens]|uniref:hypothetical protein n=1 Tax=Maridesulfovibrio ferrireducens TaxID=246191 RepID=UPI001A23C6F6|nr:hypothetical protein [Maridesulfovibrio ferrireducens]MBI9110637.1 hypothetical protein [Maridesulfovibrio ferrireducens]